MDSVRSLQNDNATFTWGLAVGGLSPRSGTPAGGTSVVVTGGGFSTTPGATTIRFSDRLAEGITCSSDTTCMARSPARDPLGPATVQVAATVNGENSPATDAALFTYELSITGLVPNAGPPAGGTLVAIVGNGFSPLMGATAFRFGDTAATEVTCESEITCRARSPENLTAVSVHVTATVSGFTSGTSDADIFTYVRRELTARPTTGLSVFDRVDFEGTGWNPVGGPIEILLDFQVAALPHATLPATDRFTGHFDVDFLHTSPPLPPDSSCTLRLVARQDGVQTSVPLAGIKDSYVVAADGVQVSKDRTTVHRMAQAGDHICQGEFVGVPDGATYAMFALTESGLRSTAVNSRALVMFRVANQVAAGWFLGTFPGATGGSDPAFSNPRENINITIQGLITFGPDANLCMANGADRALLIREETGRLPIGAVGAACGSPATPTGVSRPTTSTQFDCGSRGDTQALPDVLSGTELQGHARRDGNLRVTGRLTLSGAIVCVTGNATLEGGLDGVGLLVVDGSLDITGGIHVRADNVAALASGGDMVLRGGPRIGSTNLTAPAAAGATTLQVAGTDGFAVGDRIRINPGGPNQEDNTIAGFGSILLTTPLRNTHAAGELVVRLRETPTPTPTGTAAPPTPSPTATGTPTPTASPTLTASPTTTTTNSPTVTNTPSGSQLATTTKTPTTTKKPTSTKTPTVTKTPTITPVKTVVRPGDLSLSLNGTSAYAEAANAAELNPSSWTFEVWFKDEHPSYNHPRTRILTKGDISARDVPYFASIDSNLLYVGLRSGGTGHVVTFNLTKGGITPNAWHHVAASFNASGRVLTVYVDGVQRAQGALASGSIGNNLPLIVGRSGASGDHWKGNLDDLRIWSVVRTAAEIAATYKSEIGAAPPGLVGNWHFNEGSGNTAADIAGTPQNLSLLGGAGWSIDVLPVRVSASDANLVLSSPRWVNEAAVIAEVRQDLARAPVLTSYPEVLERVVWAAGRSALPAPSAGPEPSVK